MFSRLRLAQGVAMADGGRVPLWDGLSTRLHVDAPDVGVCGPALGMVGRKDPDRTVRHFPQDYHQSLRQATGTGWELSGVHQDAVQMDRAVASGPCRGVSPADDRNDGRCLDGGEVVGLRGRWQPRGRAAYPPERREILSEVQALARSAETSSPASPRPSSSSVAGRPRAQGEW